MTEKELRKPIIPLAHYAVEVAEKPTWPANLDENANAKNGLTFDPSSNMAKRRPKREPGLFVHISLYPTFLYPLIALYLLVKVS